MSGAWIISLTVIAIAVWLVILEAYLNKDVFPPKRKARGSALPSGKGEEEPPIDMNRAYYKLARDYARETEDLEDYQKSLKQAEHLMSEGLTESVALDIARHHISSLSHLKRIIKRCRKQQQKTSASIRVLSERVGVPDVWHEGAILLAMEEVRKKKGEDFTLGFELRRSFLKRVRKQLGLSESECRNL